MAKGAYNAVRANLPIAEILTEAIKVGGIALSQAEKKKWLCRCRGKSSNGIFTRL